MTLQDGTTCKRHSEQIREWAVTPEDSPEVERDDDDVSLVEESDPVSSNITPPLGVTPSVPEKWGKVEQKM